MAIQRVTQNMLTHRSVGALQTGLSRLARLQEQMSTGRILNRPSDSPTDTTSAMRIRSSMADVKQYGRNANDGNGWLAQIDSALTSFNDQVLRARDLALQGANEGGMGPTAREALAAEVDQIRGGLIDTANTSGRPAHGTQRVVGSREADRLAQCRYQQQVIVGRAQHRAHQLVLVAQVDRHDAAGTVGVEIGQL